MVVDLPLLLLRRMMRSFAVPLEVAEGRSLNSSAFSYSSGNESAASCMVRFGGQGSMPKRKSGRSEGIGKENEKESGESPCGDSDLTEGEGGESEKGNIMV